MVIRKTLNGAYRLYRFEDGEDFALGKAEKKEWITAEVPCNVETALTAAGKLEDIYRNGTDEARKEELCDWYFVRDFTAEETADKVFLEFDGIDTFFEVYLNGKKIGEGENALISHRFEVGGVLKTGKNELAVHIFSTLKKAFTFQNTPVCVPCLPENAESLHIRKPAYQFGWDIFPRVLSAGITGDVSLVCESGVNLKRAYLSVQYASDRRAGLQFFYDTDLSASDYGKYVLKLSLRCKDSEYAYAIPVGFRSGVKYLFLENPYLWWTNGMGEQNLYDVKATLCKDGEAVDEQSFRFGIRFLELKRSDFAGERDSFCFYLNGKELKCYGGNIVPPDVLRANVANKYASLVADLKESHANMVRIWGGGVYFDEAFFDLCDKAGILVWQDFMLACHSYPVSERLEKAVFEEAEQIVCRYANHASLGLYCGSNETDWPYYCVGLDPKADALTRSVLPKAIFKQDPNRIYLPSTPYFSEEYVKAYGGKFLIDLDAIVENRKDLPDEHYWWSRRDFRKFADISHNFVSEIGYSGAPSAQTICSFAGENFRWGDETLKARDYSTEGDYAYGIGYCFTDMPESREDKILATQIYQAEAYKFLVETARIKADLNGVLIWTFNEGWPCFTSGVVDYYGRRKLAFYYLKNSQRPIQFVFAVHGDSCEGYFVNGTLREVKCRVRIFGDGKTQPFAEAECVCPPLSRVRAAEGLKAKAFLVSEMLAEGKTAYNHVALCRKISFAEYKAFLDTMYEKIVR